MQNNSNETDKQRPTSEPAGDNTKVEEQYPFGCQICGARFCGFGGHIYVSVEVVIKDNKSDWAATNILSAISGTVSREYSVIKNLKDADITAIFNIQEEDKRPYLRQSTIISQYDVDSNKFNNCFEDFSKYNIQVFNLSIPYITTDILLKTVKQMSRILEDGHKIAVYSHVQNGKIRLLMAAWEIYHNNLPAKRAIQKARQVATVTHGKPGIKMGYWFSKWYHCHQCRIRPKKYRYYALAKEKEGALYDLEKELREARKIFYSTPKLNLEDYILRQKKIFPIADGSDALFIPKIVLSCLKRMEDMTTSGKCTAHNIALAFTSPYGGNNSLVLWDNSHEKTLESFKKQINNGKFTPDTVYDPRYLAQLTLDFFDQLTSPAIKCQVLAGDDKVEFTAENKDQFRSQIDKKEMHLIEFFANFLDRLVQHDKTSVEVVRKAILRVCISLLLERKEKDKYFKKRSMIKEQYAQDRCSQLCLFIQKWIHLD